jgi:hypothetical protein
MSADRGLEPLAAVATRLGDYVVGEPLWRLRLGEAFAARGPSGPATLYVIAPTYAQHPEVRAEIVAGTRAAAALPEHPSIVRTVAAGLTGDTLWIATEDVDGLCLRELLRRKAQGGARGLGAAGSASVIRSAAAALEQLGHGALVAESLVAMRDGRPRLADLALARGVLTALRLGLLGDRAGLAPEVAQGAAPTPAADVYGLGSLLYETLTGRPLERGGPRPSELAPGVPTQLDDAVARACHRDPARRFPSPAALREVVEDLLGRRAVAAGASAAAPLPGVAAAPDRAAASSGSGLFAAASASAPSLAQALAGGDRATPAAVDTALAMALSDATEKWLVSKGQLDYGPFSLADVVTQIEEGKIVGSHVIIDNGTGARCAVGDHPLLGPISDAAKARLDEARRVAAETAHRRTESKRSLLLNALIGVAVVAVGGGAWWGIQRARSDEKTVVGAVTGVGSASIDLNVSAPKRPARAPRNRAARGPREPGAASEDLALDFSADDGDDASETLDLDTIHKVYSRQGGALGRCLAQNGGGAANIAFTIDGPTGKVTVVRVNGQSAGGLTSCIAKIMRSLSFPTINGPRTRAEFDISM